MELLTETIDYNVSEFYEQFKTKLPVLAKITQGYYGSVNEDTFDKDEVIYIVAVSKQDRVVTKLLDGNRFRLLSIPVTFHESFCVVEPGMSKCECFLPEILRTRKLPVKVQFPPNRIITVGNKSITSNHIPAMELTETFKEMYLLGNLIIDGKFDDDVIRVPLYLSKLRLSQVIGIKGKPAEFWKIYFHQLERKSSQVEYDLFFGNQNIAEYDECVLQSGLNYSYAEPVSYESLLDIMKGRENTYATLSENKPPDRRPKTIEEFSVNGIVEQLKFIGMGKFAESFAMNKIDGKLLVKLEDELLIEEFGMTRREIIRLRSILSGEEIAQGQGVDDSQKIRRDISRRISHTRTSQEITAEVSNSNTSRQAQAMVTSTVTSTSSHPQQIAPKLPPRSYLLNQKLRLSDSSDSKQSPPTVPEALAANSKVLKSVSCTTGKLPNQDITSLYEPQNVGCKELEVIREARDKSSASSLNLKRTSSNASLTDHSPYGSNISPLNPWDTSKTPWDTSKTQCDKYNSPNDMPTQPIRNKGCVILNIASLSVEEVCNYLKEMNLHKYITRFKSELIDGAIVTQLDNDILTKEFNMTRLEAIRLQRFAKEGYIPQIHSQIEDLCSDV